MEPEDLAVALLDKEYINLMLNNTGERLRRAGDGRGVYELLSELHVLEEARLLVRIMSRNTLRAEEEVRALRASQE